MVLGGASCAHSGVKRHVGRASLASETGARGGWKGAKARGCPLRPEELWEREVYKRGEADRRLILRQMVSRRCGLPERDGGARNLECESMSSL